MTSRWARVTVALAALALAMPVTAVADGDPASDVLLGENVYYPYTPLTATAIQSKLNAETAAAARAHFPIKVALIASPVDLGVIPELFGKPQEYADYLDQEISFDGPQPLLVVMKAGYGVQGMKPVAPATLAKLPKPAGASSDDLAQAAIAAVDGLAADEGHPLSGGSGSGAATAGSGKAVLLIAVAVGAILMASTVLVLRHRLAAARRG